MRMWMIEPRLLCNKHLLGEHGEIHKFRHSFVKQHKINGRVFPVVQIEPSSMELRHNDLAAEMATRGMNHKSSYQQPDLSYLPDNIRNVKVSTLASIKDLHERCEKCRSMA